MRSKTVTMYYCDFCKKRGQSRYHIIEHEKHCTGNPERTCQMCGDTGVREITEIVPYLIPADGALRSKYMAMDSCTDRIVGILRDRLSGCPACMLATIRRMRVCLPEWSFSKEKKAWWTVQNAGDSGRGWSYYGRTTTRGL